MSLDSRAENPLAVAEKVQGTTASSQGCEKVRLSPLYSLSSKLLRLTLLFVLFAQVVVYVPSIANYRRIYLLDRLGAARTAALVMEVAPNGSVPDKLVEELLNSAGAMAIALKTGPARRLMSSESMPENVDVVDDLRELDMFRAVQYAFDALFAHNGRVLRVMGEAVRDGTYVEIVMDETPLRASMLRFSRLILLISLALSVITASLVFLAVYWLFVRPMRRLSLAMHVFRNDPENADHILPPTRRRDEIGSAEADLRQMQQSLHELLAQKSHLAALGLAVSKISHDLRNMLASAQLFSERIAGISDPSVQRFAPKLVQALDRAIAFCQSSLDYGRVQEPKPQRRDLNLHQLVEDTRDFLGLGPESAIAFTNSVDPDLIVDADPDQLLRVLTNLGRNAMQALEARRPNQRDRDCIHVSGRRAGSVVIIEVSDTGPGVPERARERMFEAFHGSARPGGTGLGLAIAAEILRAHSGAIQLVEGTLGATFRLTIPDRPVDLEAIRRRSLFG